MIYPGGAHSCAVGSADEPVGVVVRESVQVSGAASAIDVRIPLNGVNIAVVLRRAAIGRAFVIQPHAEQVGQLIAALQGTGGGVVDTCEPAA